MKIESIKKVNEPIINRQIILLFLEKLEILTKAERKEILQVIRILNYPILEINQKIGGNCYKCGKFIEGCIIGDACCCKEDCSN